MAPAGDIRAPPGTCSSLSRQNKRGKYLLLECILIPYEWLILSEIKSVVNNSLPIKNNQIFCLLVLVLWDVKILLFILFHSVHVFWDEMTRIPMEFGKSWHQDLATSVLGVLA